MQTFSRDISLPRGIFDDGATITFTCAEIGGWKKISWVWVEVDVEVVECSGGRGSLVWVQGRFGGGLREGCRREENPSWFLGLWLASMPGGGDWDGPSGGLRRP